VANLKDEKLLLLALKPGEWFWKKHLGNEIMQRFLGTEDCNKWGGI